MHADNEAPVALVTEQTPPPARWQLLLREVERAVSTELQQAERPNIREVLASVVTVAEIVQRLGYKSGSTVGEYAKRYPDFPSPVRTYTVRGNAALHLYWWPDVERWAIKHGRINEDGTIQRAHAG